VTQTLWAPTYTTDYPLADKILARKHEHNKFYVDNNA
jgi:lysyl-tRNA synthetase class II